jgi:hypothetical protein
MGGGDGREVDRETEGPAAGVAINVTPGRLETLTPGGTSASVSS